MSNAAFLSKIIEKTALIRHGVDEHIDNNELHRKFQLAYKTGDIMQAMDKAVFMVLLDLSAAFYTIDHSILLHRLSNVI